MKKDRQVRPLVQLVTERLARNWSQQDLADGIGTTPGNVSRWERGLTFPGPYFRQKLCEVFEKSAEELGLAAFPASEESERPASSDQQEDALPVQAQPETAPAASRDQPDPMLFVDQSTIRPLHQLKHYLRPSRSIGIMVLSVVLGIVLLVVLYAKVLPDNPNRTISAATTHDAATMIIPDWMKGQPVFSDTLKDTNQANTRHGWTIKVGGSTQCKFSQLYQYYQVEQVWGNYCSYGRSNWSDLAYEVDISIHQGTQGGSILRLDSILNSYYYFSIKTSGEYDFSLVLHGQARSLVSGFSPYIRQGLRAWNTLRVIAQGPVFTLAVNDHPVTTVTDRSLHQGAIGLAVGSSQGPFCLAQYQNAKVWVPG